MATDDKKTKSDEDKVLDHFRVRGVQGECFLLVCQNAPVTVRSQQIRALNLAWALDRKQLITDKNIAVIGGGAAGLTFATAAAVLGASRVKVYEKSSQL